MSTSDLLTKLVLHEKQIVTYRTLSRLQSIHVNQAKNELAAFYQATKSKNAASIHATFIVTGLAQPDPKPANGLAEDDMDLDMPSSSQTQEPETGFWGANKTVLCTEEALESTKSSLAKVRSVHVYSLSAAPIKDSSMLSTTLESVRKADGAASQDQLRALGIAIGDVSLVTTKSSAKGKSKAVEPVAPAPVKAEEKKAEAAEKKAPSRNGTLNFGAPKPKAELKSAKETPAAPVKEVAQQKPNAEEPELKKGETWPSKPPEPQRSVSGLGRKRGLVMSEDEDDAHAAKPESAKATTKPTTKATTTAKPKSKQNLPTKKEDEEDEDEDAPIRPGARKTNGKSQKAKSGNEASLAAMFDDSSDVEMQPAAAVEPAPPPKEEVVEVPNDVGEEEEEEDVVETNGIDKKTKRKPKAKPKDGAIVMKDGKKKKRVVKSKMTTDARGYMTMEDYSEYETVSESEELTIPEKPKKATPRKTDTPKTALKEDAPKPKPKPKPNAAGAGKKGTGKLSDFFSKK